MQRYTPNSIFPTDNDYGIPTLDPDLDAGYFDVPIVGWGTQARNEKMTGTYHFYRDDYKFEGLWKNPEKVVNSKCVTIVEPNFSHCDTDPKAAAIWQAYRKRWLSRYWQTKGIRTIVDLDVPEAHEDVGFLGVPKGWKTFSTKGCDDKIERLIHHYHVAKRIAETDKINMLVIAGGSKVRRECERHGWVYVPPTRQRPFKIVSPDSQSIEPQRRLFA